MQVTGPFQSILAEGHFGGILTGYTHTGRSYIIEKRKRRGLFVSHRAGYGVTEYGASFYGFAPVSFLARGSEIQGVQRENFKQSWSAYALLTTGEKAQYSKEARNLNMTGANLFMSRWLQSRRA